ncbi:chromosome segregation protein SMC [Candidatus Amarobacter glycogenicus]|uniref:chromosome segregation protein SMC n=1 Tax=Candidatus Amarobacter glycogenicus TaxID=3140699 RepID=UPI003135FE29|nr:chromosome segregation protein SMC [Dehalococcoidia bacterium]MBK9342383.1 chromosome segregation protein SMC [Dehalococcoidia bacterium]
MYLKRLSVQGFKSFANRTQFEYGRGITAVVGPNGSGKSNVSDAIRWVLGEQSSKLLRAKKQEDVIFSGTKDRAAVGMAEVALTLDNEGRWLPVDFAEVEIARRVYRNGDSEYLLNGSRVRLRDVIDLLMKGDVGQNSYSIMGQGLVDEVLSMSPDERRSFLDEAADVKRFRLKIREAQDRLSATRDNIDRVSLIIDEIEPRLAHLSRQAERAAEHKRLSAELLDLLKTYYGHQWNEAQNALVRVRAELDQGTAENTAAAQRVTQLREQLRALSDEIRKRREAIGRRDTRNSEIDQRLATAEQALVLDRERHNMVSSRREEVRMELEAIEAERLSLASTDVDDGRRGIEVVGEAETAREGMQRTRQELDAAEREYSTLRSRSQELHDGADGDDRRANAMDSDIESAQRRIADLERELEQLVARRKQIIVELIGYGRRYCEARASVAEGEINLEAARREADSAREQLVRVQEEVREFESSGNQDLRELDHLEGRLDALSRVQAEHDGVAAGTRNVLIMGQALMDEFAPGSMGEPPEVPGVVGLLSRQIKVPAGLEVAINAALEQRLHAVVVENETVALEAIGALQRRKQGRAQFMPLDSVRHVYPLNLQKERGVVGVASKLIRCENRVKQLVDTLLGRVIIVEDVQSGLRMVKRALGSVVTLDGVYIEQTGVMAGGSTGADEGEFIRQRELEELPERIEELRKRTEVSAERVADARAAIEQVAKRSHETEAEYEMTRRSLEGARFDLERERERLHRLRRDMDTVYSKRADIERERAGRESQILQARTAAIQLQQRRDERRAAMEALQADLQLATERREAALRSVSEASARLATVEGERRTLTALREQHEKSIDRLDSQIQAKRLQARNLELEGGIIDERLGKLALELENARAEQARYAEDAAPDRDELHRLENHERTIQDEFNEAQTTLLTIERRRLDQESELARTTEHLEHLRLEMEREGLAPDRAGQIVPFEDAMATDPMFSAEELEAPRVQGGAEIDVETMRARIEELRRQIRRLGTINAEAPEDFREFKERHEFLTTQLADLTDSSDQLRTAIADLNEEIRTRFTATFHTVNTKFAEYFAAFFGGGVASLSLTDPHNLADAGVEIEAQPPGKRIKSLSLLSGGERSLTAVALLFALLAANPAPFCVLDEVDAALDEANVGRFTTALRQLAEKTQFLVVTHNRRTIEVADAIYGVSMGRDGVSKVLSLRLADIPQN